jgi:hypothetical protein
MNEEDAIEMKKEVVPIEGGRELYNYTFKIEADAPEGGEQPQQSQG